MSKEEKKELYLLVRKLIEGYSIRKTILDSLQMLESRKFVVGNKFEYTDKYGVSHECTITKRVETTDFDSDYKIADITFTYPTMGSPKEVTVPIYKSEQRDSYGDEYFVAGSEKGQSKDGSIPYSIATWVFPN